MSAEESYSPNECSVYDTKQWEWGSSNSEVWGNAEYLFIGIAPWSVVVVSDRDLSVDQIQLFDI